VKDIIDNPKQFYRERRMAFASTSRTVCKVTE
jgi:hypothetical protein